MGGSIWNTINDFAKVPQNIGTTIQDIASNPAANFNGLADWFSGDKIDNGRYEGAFGFGQTAASAAPSVRDLAPKIEDEQEFVEIDVAQKRFLSISEQKELASYALYGVPKFYIPPILMVNSANALAQLEGYGAEKNDVRCFIFISVGDLKIEDTTYPRNVPILKVPDADIDAVQDLGFGSGTIKVSGRLWGEAGYARLRTLRELCKTRRPLIWSAQETQAWLVFPQNVPGINTVANMPGQYFFEVTLVCVGKIADRDPIVKAALQTRTALVKHKFAREMAVLTAHKQFKKFSATGSGFFWNPSDEETLAGQVSSGLSQALPSNSGLPSTSGAGGLATTESQNNLTVPDVKQAAAKKNAEIKEKRTLSAPQNSNDDLLIADKDLADYEINPATASPVKVQESDNTIVLEQASPVALPAPIVDVGDYKYSNNNGVASINGKELKDISTDELLAYQKRMLNNAKARYAEAEAMKDTHSPDKLSLVGEFRQDARRHQEAASKIGREIIRRSGQQPSLSQAPVVSQAATMVLGKDMVKFNILPSSIGSAATNVGQSLSTTGVTVPNPLALVQSLQVDIVSGVAEFFNGKRVAEIALDILQAYKQISQYNLNQAVMTYNAAIKVGAISGASNAMYEILKFQSAINVISLEMATRTLGVAIDGIPEAIVGGQSRQIIANETLAGMNAQAASCNGLAGDAPSNLGGGIRFGGFSGATAMSGVRAQITPAFSMPPASVVNPENYKLGLARITKEKVLK